MEIILEELNAENLKNRTDIVINKLQNEIKVLKTSNNREQTEKGNEQLKTLTDDFQQLVQKTRILMMKPISNEIRIIANKVEELWKDKIYPLIIEYDNQVDEFNKNNNTNLKHISERTGNKILKSIKTNYFNY